MHSFLALIEWIHWRQKAAAVKLVSMHVGRHCMVVGPFILSCNDSFDVVGCARSRRKTVVGAVGAAGV